MEYLKVVLDVLLPLVAVAAVAILTPALRGLALGLAHKLGVDLDKGQEERLLGIVSSGIHLAEEWAHKRLAAGAEKPAGAEKLERALRYVRDEADRAGLSQWVQARGIDLGQLIEARIRKVLGS